MGRRSEVLALSWKEYCRRLDEYDKEAWEVLREYFPDVYRMVVERLSIIWDYAEATLDSFEYFVNTFRSVVDMNLRGDDRLDTFYSTFPIVRSFGLDPHTATFGEVYSYISMYGHSGQDIRQAEKAADKA